MSLKIYLANDLPGRHIIHYTLQLIAFNKSAGLTYIDDAGQADLKVTNDAGSDIPLSAPFYQYLTELNFEAIRSMAKDSYLFYAADGRQDLMASIFYLVNSVQEYDTKTFDQYGRYPFMNSVQHRLNIIHENIVQQLIDEFLRSHPSLAGIKSTVRRSGFFLTHDIDTVYGAKNQNGDHALKNHKYHKIPALLWNHYIGTPDWINMDYIMEIEGQYDFKSAFYWLVHEDEKNADYDISETVIQDQLTLIHNKGFEIGLHKSLQNTSLAEEKQKLGLEIIGQRYHFLRFNLPQAWTDIEAAKLKLDTSLGFSEDFGFRNSYGLPFMPYNIKEKRVYDMIEVPMNVMDGNFFYHGKTLVQAEKELINWLDKNKENAIITINFHNNFFDDMLYAGYKKLYETLLRYFKEENLSCMTQASLISEFYKPALFSF